MSTAEAVIYCPICGRQVTVPGKVVNVLVIEATGAPTNRTYVEPTVDFGRVDHVCNPPDASTDRGS